MVQCGCVSVCMCTHVSVWIGRRFKHFNWPNSIPYVKTVISGEYYIIIIINYTICYYITMILLWHIRKLFSTTMLLFIDQPPSKMPLEKNPVVHCNINT